MFDIAFIAGLVANFGYLGVFIGSLLGSMTLFFPVPSFLFAVSAGALLDPLWVGIVAGLGSAIGELVGYPIGRGISYGLDKRKHRKHKKINAFIEKWFDRKLGWLVIFLFAVTPLPDDFVVIFCGMIRYDIRKVFIPLLAGKIIFSLALAYAGHYGLQFIL